MFLNDVEFTDEFKTRMKSITNDNAEFGVVDSDSWNYPPSIDLNMAKMEWEKMPGVPNVKTLSYHNMCRFFSMYFYKHPLVQKYDYYWRVEPDVQFHCDINFDPFDEMYLKNKKYGFVLAVREFMDSIKSLMGHTTDFLINNYPDIKKQNNLKFMFESGNYNGCHFWSNFEIGSFDFFRSEIYNKYVNYLEEKKGFYYERWGDAPIHSLAAALFLDKSQIIFFNKIGYSHGGITHCPKEGENCSCNVNDNIDHQPYSCIDIYLAEQ